MSDFKIIGVVSKEEIPEGIGRRAAKFEPLLEKIDAMPIGKYLHVQVTKPHHVKSIKLLLSKRRPLLNFDVFARGWDNKVVLNVYIKRMK